MKLIIICLLVGYNFCLGQNRTVKFRIVERYEISMPGVNVIEKNSNPVNETQTDINGNSELVLPKNEVKISLSFLAPSRPEFEIQQNVDSVKVDLVKKKAVCYSQKRIVEKVALKY